MKFNFKKVVVMGMGYIGLPTSALLAQEKFIVHGVDINEKAVETINKGKIHIVEPSLEGLVFKAVHSGKLSANLIPAKADVFIIAVPTPLSDELKPDLSYVLSAVNAIIPYIEEGNLIILESTSPVGSTEKIRDLIFSKREELIDKIYVAYCPERVLPGKIIYELEHNDRVIGGINDESTEAALSFYGEVVKGELFSTNSRTAEMVKLTENSYRDVNIAFANELSIICNRHNIDVHELITMANRHPRVNILKPGCGVGGHCIAVDPWFIVDLEPEFSRLIRTAREVNDFKPKWIVEAVIENVESFKEKNKKNPSISIFGITYKPDVDDIRESPALKIAIMLAEHGEEILIVEPNLEELPKKLAKYENIRKVSLEEAQEADFGLMLVKHREFKELLEKK